MDRHYFHFPLCALTFGRDIRERLNCIISFCCVEMGVKQWEKFSPNERVARRSFYPPPHVCTCKIDLRKKEELQVVAGCEYLTVVCQNVEGTLAAYARLKRFVEDFERKHGTDARVRICTDWIFEVRDNKGMSYPELAVLAAIYSKIGASKSPVRITREEIWRRAHGCKSDRVFRTEMKGRRPFRTERQVRSIIERLHGRNFFARITYGRRQTYYSNRQSSSELADHVFKIKVQRSLARQARRRADAGVTKRIQAERRRLAGPAATEGATDMPL
jgi:hypothetical protein